MSKEIIDVSIIIPVYNAEPWLDECLDSVIKQEFPGNLEVSVFDDGSTDNSKDILKLWSTNLQQHGIKFILSSNTGKPKGVGYAKNQAVIQSTGTYLCFLDADDVMLPARISKQYDACYSKIDTIVGCHFCRKPDDSTPRYTNWANSLKPEQLYLQIYTAFGPTVVMPTWFCHRKVFDRVGSFSEEGKGTPEDLLFFYQHLKLGGHLARVGETLLMYRYHPTATTFSISEDTIWKLRLRELEKNVLSKWPQFTIWNAGKQGRKFYRSLSSQNKAKVIAFCDVDVKKLSKGVYIYEECKESPKPRIPIIHFSIAKPPFILCVKIDMTKGSFEENLASLNLTEGKNYFHFS